MSRFQKILDSRPDDESILAPVERMIRIYNELEQLLEQASDDEKEALQAKLRITDKLICQQLEEQVQKTDNPVGEDTADSESITEQAPGKPSMVKILEGLVAKNGQQRIYPVTELKTAGLDIAFNAAKIQIGSYCLVQPLLSVRKSYRIEKI